VELQPIVNHSSEGARPDTGKIIMVEHPKVTQQPFQECCFCAPVITRDFEEAETG